MNTAFAETRKKIKPNRSQINLLLKMKIIFSFINFSCLSTQHFKDVDKKN